jgi:3-methylcrotonyl-CoA carboxylase alpha subunit
LEYRLKINEKVVPAEVEAKDGGGFNVVMEGNSYDFTCEVISDNQLHLVINGRQVTTFLLEKNDSVKEVMINGIPYTVEDADRAGLQPGRRRRSEAIPKEITPPMPSVVIRLLVAEGDIVSRGDGIIVVSAMKMETTLSAPYDGQVTRINVSEGEKVMPGQILVDIDKME